MREADDKLFLWKRFLDMPRASVTPEITVSEILTATKEEILDEFWQAGSCSGSICRDCRHGTTFFNDDDRAGTWDDGELEGLRLKAAENPSQYVALDGDPHFTEMFGIEWCWDCARCRGEALKYQRIIWDSRREIATFLNARLKSKLKEVADDFEYSFVGADKSNSVSRVRKLLLTP